MTTDNRTPAEIAYDATRLSRTPAQPAAAPEAPHDIMTRLFEMLEEDDELTIAQWVDERRAEALQAWHGTTTTNDDGEFRRYPELPPVEIAALKDGTPVLGAFDNDDEPRTVDLVWGEFSIIADCDGFDFSDDTRDYGHVTYEQWARLAALAQSGALEQLRDIAAKWEGQGTPAA